MQKIRPFTSDGCSGGMSFAWRLVFRKPPPWEACCFIHDIAYWKGGTKEERRKADERLYYDVVGNGYPIIAYLMWISVRLGGHPAFPFPWRWGYGYRWPTDWFYK